MFDHYSSEPVFNVKSIAHQTGVAAATLRAWERRYGIPSPPRTDSGYRLYSAKDIAIIRWLRGQVDNGLSISQAVQLLNSVASKSPNAHGGQTADKIAAQTPPSSYARLHDDIVAAALEFDEARIECALGEAFSLFSVEDVCVSVVQPVLVSLGALWASGEITISVEHFVTNLMRRKLLTLMMSSPVPTRTERIVAACAPGEYHEIGVLMLALFLRRRGYSVIYLGQNIAVARLQEMLMKIRPDLLLVSASSLIPAANLLDVCRDVRRASSWMGLNIAFGGRIFNRLPALRERVPAMYIGEDAQQAQNLITDFFTKLHGSVPLSVAMQAQAAQDQTAFNADPALAETLAAYRSRRAGIVSVAAQSTESHQGEDDGGRRMFEVLETLVDIADAALRFGLPDILADTANWYWDALPPYGLGSIKLQTFAMALAYATRVAVHEPHSTRLKPYLRALESGLERETRWTSPE